MYNVQKSDVFSLGLSFLQVANQDEKLNGMNFPGIEGENKISESLKKIKNDYIRTLLSNMLKHCRRERYDL